MSTKSVRVLNIAAGVLLIAAGVYCLCNQDIAVLSAGLLLGLFMLVSGVIEIAVFAGTSGVLIGSGWLLLDGVLTVIMSLFLLFNQWFTMLSLPFLFTIWLLFSGISRFVSAFDLRALGVRAWGWVLAMSCKALDGMHGMFEERAREYGIHLVWVSHDLFDPRVISRQGVRDQINNYMRTVMGEEPVDPSLEVLHDEESW